jgi:hypothetical protein
MPKESEKDFASKLDAKKNPYWQKKVYKEMQPTVNKP